LFIVVLDDYGVEAVMAKDQVLLPENLQDLGSRHQVMEVQTDNKTLTESYMLGLPHLNL
jgi:hypothetical protein